MPEPAMGLTPCATALPEPPLNSAKFQWIPVRSLAPRAKPRIRAHLLNLEASDRYLRFGYMATDEQISRYVDSLNFERDEIFGVFNRRLELVAMAHLAYLPPSSSGELAAEFGVSVGAQVRGRGYGARLFDHAALHARNRNIAILVIHALSENAAMLSILKKAGAQVERSGPETQARLELPPDDFSSRVEALVEDQAAELDYGVKVQVRRVDRILDALTNLQHEYGKLSRTASE